MQEKTMSRQNMAADNALMKMRTMDDDIDMLLDLMFGDIAEIVKEATGETIHVTIRKAGTP